MDWKKGPPPHVGWWNASKNYNPNSWRWWNGRKWSFAAFANRYSAEDALASARHADTNQKEIEWNDSYPENARVPRVDPRA